MSSNMLSRVITAAPPHQRLVQETAFPALIAGANRSDALLSVVEQVLDAVTPGAAETRKPTPRSLTNLAATTSCS